MPTPPTGQYSPPPYSLPITVPSTVSEMLSKSEKYVTSPVDSTSPEKGVFHPHTVSSRDVAALYARSFYPGSGTSYHHQHHHHSHRHHLDHQVLKSIRDRYYKAPHLSNHSASAIYHARSTAGKRSPDDLHYMYGTAPPPEILRNSSYHVLPGNVSVPLPPSPIKSPSTKIHPNNKFEASQLLLKVTEPSSHAQQKALLQQQHPTTTPENSRHFPAGNYPLPPPPAALPLPMKAGRGRTSKDSTTTTKLSNTNKTPTKYLITADGEQRPQCPECFQTFKKRAALERHMMIHRGIKPFQCHFCNQRFRQKHHLQGHIMLHTGERPVSYTHLTLPTILRV